MRKRLLVGQGLVLALMFLAITASSTGFAAGPLGAVEIKRGEPVTPGQEIPSIPYRRQRHDHRVLLGAGI